MAHKDQDSLYEYPIIYSHFFEETFLPPTEVEVFAFVRSLLNI